MALWEYWATHLLRLRLFGHHATPEEWQRERLFLGVRLELTGGHHTAMETSHVHHRSGSADVTSLFRLSLQLLGSRARRVFEFRHAVLRHAVQFPAFLCQENPFLINGLV